MAWTPDGQVHTYESASSHQGVGDYVREPSFWAISVRHPAYANEPADPVPDPVEDDEMFRIIKGDKTNDLWLTNWLTKRHIGTPAEADAITKSGVTNGRPAVVWPEAFVDAIPVSK